MTDHDHTTDRPETDPTASQEYTVPPDADPLRCEYCAVPFVEETSLALHRGLEHESRLTETQQAAFEAAYDAEREEIRLFRLKALAALVVLYFGLLMTYSVFA